MDATIARCTFDEVESDPDFYGLVDDYTRESALPELWHGTVQVAMYRAMEQTGALRVYASRTDGGKKLAGFMFLLVSTLPHSGFRAVVTESIYVAPAYRQTGAGLKFLRLAERVARDEGAKTLLVSCPLHSRIADVAAALRYRECSRVFVKDMAP